MAPGAGADMVEAARARAGLDMDSDDSSLKQRKAKVNGMDGQDHWSDDGVPFDVEIPGHAAMRQRAWRGC